MTTFVQRIGILLLVVTMTATGAYVFIYLYRWEWNRAIVSGVLFIAAEVALIAWLLATRLHRIDRRLDDIDSARHEQRLDRIRESAPDSRVGFRWLARPDRLGVFVPVLMGAGVALSALAWMVERVARATAQPVAEQRLAARLRPLSLPPGGFLARSDDGLDLLRGPVTGRRR
jgi:hypothetical protein